MTHRLSGDRANAQVCEETWTMVKSIHGASNKTQTSRKVTYECDHKALKELTAMCRILKSHLRT